MLGAERAPRTVAERKGAVVTPAALVQYIHRDLKDSTNLTRFPLISDKSCNLIVNMIKRVIMFKQHAAQFLLQNEQVLYVKRN